MPAVSREDYLPFGPKWGGGTRTHDFAPGGSHAITPRFDALGPEERLDPQAPVLEATIGGRQVYLARPDPRMRAPGSRLPRNYTVPLTVSRMDREYDLEYGRASSTYEPSALVGIGSVDGGKWAAVVACAAIAFGAYVWLR